MDFSIGFNRKINYIKRNEIKIIKDNKEIWRKTATSDNKITGPLYWPIKSFEVNDSYVLRVRPDGIPMGNYADIKLEASKDKITKVTKEEIKKIKCLNISSIEYSVPINE